MLVFLFTLAVLAILVAVNFLMLVVLGTFESLDESWLAPGFFRRNAGIIFWTSLITFAIIFLASSYRGLQLRSGGAEVARELGGSPLEPDTSDPLRRRLRNVVEEMAIASGIPAPEIFVLENEPGINAFAAGWSPADASIAVTRGTLEHLNRDELQGVIAHEFSHVFNGDMRLNIRLVGALFGILVMALIGRRMLTAMRFTGRNRNTGPILMFGLALMVIGYIGLFFARWIKAAVSRQREYLADASAVQFTRHPQGIAGALKKIGALSQGSRLVADSEEIGHMLFARGLPSQLFSTHPPLEARIRAIEPGFDPGEFNRIATQLDRHRQARAAEEAEDARVVAPGTRGKFPLDAGAIVDSIGQPGLGQVLVAAALAAEIPRALERAAHSDEWAPELVCYLLLSPDPEVRENQLLMIAQALGTESEQQARALHRASPELLPESRIPLLDIAFPALRRRPAEELTRLLSLLDDLVHADGRVDVFEYALARLAAVYIRDTLAPVDVRASGRRRLDAAGDEIDDLMAILAAHGHPGDPETALAAYRAGMDGLIEEIRGVEPRLAGDWPARLDRALDILDELKSEAKSRLVEGMARCVAHDGQVVPAEMELMRAICGSLHVPLPVPGNAGADALRSSGAARSA